MEAGKRASFYLNIGSGQRPFKPPFYNYDIQEEKWKTYTEELGCRWWAVCTKDVLMKHHVVDMIVLHHMLEHFGCGEADPLLIECYDMLKPGGSLLVFVPNMEALFRGWKLGRIDTQLLMTNIYGAYMGDEADRHKWGYDFNSLAAYLKGFGFSEVRAFDWRPIEGADIAGPDWWILGMEAIK